MLELGNILNTGHDADAADPTPHGISDVTEPMASTKIADNDADVAVVRNSFHAEEIRETAENTGYLVYSEVGELVAKLREEIKAINSFDGFLLGVHDRIEEVCEPVEFGLQQVLDVERNMARLRVTLELDRFSLTRVRAEALKALRCQGNLEPERVLHLLKG